MDQDLSPPNSDAEAAAEVNIEAAAEANVEADEASDSSDSWTPGRDSPYSPMSPGDIPSPVFQDGARFEFIQPKIPTPEIPSVQVQEDKLRELAQKEEEHALHKVCDEYLDYQTKRKLAKRALLRYQHRLTALGDVMGVMDIPQATFDLISPKFKAPPPVPLKISFEQFWDDSKKKLEQAKSLIRANTEQTMDQVDPIGLDNQPANATDPQPVAQDDEVRIMTYRINKLSTIYPQ